MNDAQTQYAYAFQQVYGFVEFQIREKFNKNIYTITPKITSYLLTVSGFGFLLNRF